MHTEWIHRNLPALQPVLSSLLEIPAPVSMNNMTQNSDHCYQLRPCKRPARHSFDVGSLPAE